MINLKELPLTEEEKQKVVDYFCKEIDAAEDERAEMLRKAETHLKQYMGRMEREQRGTRKSNIDSTLTREMSQQSVARMVNPFFAEDKVFLCVPDDPNLYELALEREEILEYITQKIDLQTLAERWVTLGHIFPYVPVKIRWVERRRPVKEWVMQDMPLLDEKGNPVLIPTVDPMTGQEMLVPQMHQQRVEVETEVEEFIGAEPDVLMPPDVIFPSGSKSPRQAPWISHRFWLSKSEMRSKIRDGVYKAKIDAVAEPETQRPDYVVNSAKVVGIDLSSSKAWEGHEIYTTVEELYCALGSEPKKLGSPRSEVIVTIEKSTKQYMRGVYNWMHSIPRPFVFWSYEPPQDGMIGTSLAFILEPMHRVDQALLNQELDAQSLANKKLILAKKGSGAEKLFKNGELVDGFYEMSFNDKNDFIDFHLSQPRDTSPQLRQEVRMRAQQLASLNPYNFGQEQIDRPTASGQIRVIEEGQQLLNQKIDQFRERLADVAKIMLDLYRQHFPEGMDYYLRDVNNSGRAEWAAAALEERIFIETKVSSTTINKNLRKQEALAMVDKIPQVYMTLSQMLQQAVTPSPMSAVMGSLVQGYQLVLDEWMKLFEIPNRELLNPDLTGAVDYGQMVYQLQQQNQMLQQQNMQLGTQLQMLQGPPPGVAGPPMPPGGGPGVPPPPPGVAGPMPGGPVPIGPPPGP